MATAISPESGSNFQIVQHYPVELVGTRDIHQFVPHLPVYVSRYYVGQVSIPFGDYESDFDKLGILVDQHGQDTYGLTLLSDENLPYPNCLDHRHALSGEVGRFVLDASLRRSKQVTAFTPEGESVEINAKYSRLLSSYLMGAVDVAKIRNARYSLNHVS